MESTVLMTMSEFKMHTMRAYIAGIIDGEGCFQFYIRQRNVGAEDKPARTRADYGLTITNTDLPMLEKVRDFLRVGNITTDCKSAGLTVYRYVVHKKDDIKEVIRILLPHLVIKKQQAILMNMCLDNLQDHGLCAALAVLMAKMKKGFKYETE